MVKTLRAWNHRAAMPLASEDFTIAKSSTNWPWLPYQTLSLPVCYRKYVGHKNHGFLSCKEIKTFFPVNRSIQFRLETCEICKFRMVNHLAQQIIKKNHVIFCTKKNIHPQLVLRSGGWGSQAGQGESSSHWENVYVGQYRSFWMIWL